MLRRLKSAPKGFVEAIRRRSGGDPEAIRRRSGGDPEGGQSCSDVEALSAGCSLFGAVCLGRHCSEVSASLRGGPAGRPVRRFESHRPSWPLSCGTSPICRIRCADRRGILRRQAQADRALTRVRRSRLSPRPVSRPGPAFVPAPPSNEPLSALEPSSVVVLAFARRSERLARRVTLGAGPDFATELVRSAQAGVSELCNAAISGGAG